MCFQVSKSVERRTRFPKENESSEQKEDEKNVQNLETLPDPDSESKERDPAKKPEASNVQSFFFYGTLRDDDKQPVGYQRLKIVCPKIRYLFFELNKKFQEIYENTECVNGCVRGYKLYAEKGIPYPFALKTGKDEDIIVGRLVKVKNWTDWQEKLRKVCHI